SRERTGSSRTRCSRGTGRSASGSRVEGRSPEPRRYAGRMRQELDRRALTALAGGHLAVDFANGALPALLPFLKDRFGLSYTLAAALMLASAFFSSLLQPLFGLWSDRRGAYWLMPAGVAVAGIGIALAAASPSYWLVLLLV